MKKIVVLSTYCWIISALTLALFCGIIVYIFQQQCNQITVWTICTLFICVLLGAVWYMPMALAIDKDKLDIYRPLRVKSISVADIHDVKLCPPTMGERRIFGSGGFMGHYGWFSERDLGTYFAYYGKSSDCFLVTLKNSKKYMLGCKDASEMVEAIKILIAANKTDNLASTEIN